MPRFAANLSWMFLERPFLGRFAAAAEAGFWAVEIPCPYVWPVQAIRRRLEDSGLSPILIDSPAGDRTTGGRGLASLPGKQREFRDGMLRALDISGEVGCRRIHVLAGLVPEGADPDRYWQTYLDNLRWSAELVRGTGVEIVIEPISRRDLPGYLLSTTDQAVAALEAVSASVVHLLFDVYQSAKMGEDPEGVLKRHVKRIRHIQVAGIPGRREPENGGMDYPRLFELLDDLEFEGWVGCEYRPRRGTVNGLAWAQPYGIGYSG